MFGLMHYGILGKGLLWGLGSTMIFSHLALTLVLILTIFALVKYLKS
ncbi:MAG: hypothetical protein M1355_00860 [Patescibacteria group bacterium]|nr:hypothetical protein [Patescibacteria group bacterium]